MVAKVKIRSYSGLSNDFLNYLCENNIAVFNIVFDQFGFTAVCYAEDYKFIAKAGKKYQVKVRIQQKKGLWFSCRVLLKRKGIIAGAAVILVILYLFSFLIWDIKINISDEAMKNELTAQLFNRNIYPGIFYTEEKLTKAEKELLRINDKIKYISLNFYKGVLNCEINLKTTKEDYLFEMTNENIYAKLSGIISNLRVYDGYSVVKLGQSVMAGDVLVSSTYTDKHSNSYSSNTMAYIEAICDKTYSIEIPFNKREKIFTGESFAEKTIYFLDYEKNIITVDDSVKQNSVYKSQLEYFTFLGFHLPLTVKTTHYYTLQRISITSDSLTARKIGQLQIEYMIQSDEKLKQEINRQYEYVLGENSITVHCHINGYYDIT